MQANYSPNQPNPESHDTSMPQLPKLWIGYVITVFGLVAVSIESALNPELLESEAQTPVSYSLLTFGAWIYWLYCVYKFHFALGRFQVMSTRSLPLEQWRCILSPSTTCTGRLSSHRRLLSL